MSATRVSRAAFAVGVSAYATVLVKPGPLGAAEFNYKMSDDIPASHPLSVFATRAADKIREETDGRLDIKLFANGQLGGQQNIISQVRLGAVEFMLSADNNLAALVPPIAITGLPFAFNSYNQAWTTLRGPLGTYLRNAVAKASLNMYLFGESWDIGFRQLMNTVRPVSAADDLKGLRMRTPSNQVEIAMFKAFGAAPTVVDGAEVYAALQTHLIDGFDSVLGGVETNKWYEPAKLYGSITNHIWTRYGLYVNSGAWEKLPKPVRDIAEKNLNAFAVAERNEVAKGDAGFESALQGHGVQFTHPASPPFKRALQAAGSYQQWRDQIGSEAWGLLERAVGKLE